MNAECIFSFPFTRGNIDSGVTHATRKKRGNIIATVDRSWAKKPKRFPFSLRTDPFTGMA